MPTKGKATAERAKGNVKEVVGRATKNRSLEAKGRAEQAKGNARAAVKNAKDALSQ